MKPESRFIKKVHDKLHPDVYREKMFNPLRGGTPDVYYMGYATELWVEYKWVKAFPKRTTLKPDLTPLQLAWLMRAHDRGRKPWVVVGSPTGCTVLAAPQQWMGTGCDIARVISIAELALEIQTRCGLDTSPRGP